MRILSSLTILALAVVLPSVAHAGDVYAVDGSSQTIVRFDAATGTVMGSVPTPTLASGNADGLAASGSSLFFVNANGSNMIHEIDAVTGADLNAFPAPLAVGGTDGLAVVGGFLYSLDAAGDTIFKIDRVTGAVVGSCTTGLAAAGGLAGEGDRLFVLLGLVDIAELNPDDCSVVGGPFAAPDFLFGLGFDGEMLYASGFQNQLIYTLDPDTGAVVDSFDPGFAASGVASTQPAAGGGGGLEVEIDIRPGSCKNQLNTVSNGMVSVVLLGSDEFDVALIDTETVHIFGATPFRWSWGDEAGAGDCDHPLPDGHLDAVLRFHTQALVQGMEHRGESLVDGAELMLQLEGATTAGTPFAGDDTVTLQAPDKGGRGSGRLAHRARVIDKTASKATEVKSTSGRTFDR